ncbi:hypothetical protein ACFL34_04060 [Candidatus Sumerlaeota bacterium]
MKRQIWSIAMVLNLTVLTMSCSVTETITLENDVIRAELTAKGLSQIHDKQLGFTIGLDSDSFSLTVNDDVIESAALTAKLSKQDKTSVDYVYDTGKWTVTVVYELKPTWRFVSKQLMVTAKDGSDYNVKSIKLFDGKLRNEIREVYRLAPGRSRQFGLSLRLKDEGKRGCFVLVQNPRTAYAAKGQSISAVYDPEMNWQSKDGAFPSDRLCIGAYKLTGSTFRYDMAREWEYVQDPAQFLKEGSQIDWAEIEALTECARAFLRQDRQKSIRVHIPWCENDYQIDRSTEEGKVEYRRIIDQAAAMGCQYVLHTSAHNEIAPLQESRDAWGWENVLWFNLGQKIRKDEWIPGKDPLPNDVQAIIDYSKSKGVKLLAYVYPSMPFMQNPEWTKWLTSQGKSPRGYLTVDTGLRSYQDWLVNKLLSFCEATTCAGVSFDHWWIAYDDEEGPVSSKYQQWFGTRRILDELRAKFPEIIIDSRQQVHHFGTWTWLAGSYPHPMMSDEQPGSFNAIVDLSTDRVNGARQRYIAWRLMTRDFCPTEILPGFITHQTMRSDAQRKMRKDRYRPRDWDYLGWKYNLLSSVATAPFNHVINYVPARDVEEFKSFSAADKEFFNYWLDFTDENAKYMKRVRPIIGQPMIGRCDGTSAIIDDEGYIFLFNPNYRAMKAEFKLDSSIGLSKGSSFMLRELYPEAGRHIAAPGKGIWGYGDDVSIAMGGISAVVLKVEPTTAEPAEPVLFGAVGQARASQGVLTLTDVSGQVGEERALTVALTDASKIKNVTVNGRKAAFKQAGAVVTCKVKFDGEPFTKAQQIGEYDSGFNGTVVEGKFTIPKRIATQLAERKKAWPVTLTEDDLVAPWMGPSRLLLFAQIADPYESNGGRRRQAIRKESVKIEIDGKPVEVKEGYNGVYPYVGRSCMGMYAEITDLATDVEHSIKVTLPAGLAPGQFQGLFFEHVENEFTTAVSN